MNSLRTAIAEAIRRRMEALGDLNPSQVAKRARDQITPAGVRNILRAESGVMVETLVIIAEALDTTAPLLLIEALSPKTEGAATPENQRLLTFYFQNVPEMCQLYMLASAKGIYDCQNENAKVFERSAARAATRGMLAAEAAQHLAAPNAAPEIPPQVATSTTPAAEDAPFAGNAVRVPKPKREAYGAEPPVEENDELRRAG